MTAPIAGWTAHQTRPLHTFSSQHM
jgi:hypothetical protein